MNEFVSNFWPWFIFVPTLLGFIGLLWLIRWMSKPPTKPEGDTTGHSWDGLEEYNNPLPSWWLNLFYASIFFGVIYLLLYPGSGVFNGFLGWSSQGRYTDEMEMTNKHLKPMYDAYLKRSIPDLAKDITAMKTGARLFINNCTTCHGSDGGGAKGFPSLRDHDWLYGGAPELIEKSILDGRTGVMPPWRAALKGDEATQLVDYVLSLSNSKHDAQKASLGKVKYSQLCVGCHGSDGKGVLAVGAPNLTDSIWLHGGSREAILASIVNGRSGTMPAHRELLGEAKIRLIAAYVFSLSQTKESTAPK